MTHTYHVHFHLPNSREGFGLAFNTHKGVYKWATDGEGRLVLTDAEGGLIAMYHQGEWAALIVADAE